MKRHPIVQLCVTVACPRCNEPAGRTCSGTQWLERGGNVHEERAYQASYLPRSAFRKFDLEWAYERIREPFYGASRSRVDWIVGWMRFEYERTHPAESAQAAQAAPKRAGVDIADDVPTKQKEMFLLVPCFYCGASIGEPCKTSSGGLLRNGAKQMYCHKARYGTVSGLPRGVFEEYENADLYRTVFSKNEPVLGAVYPGSTASIISIMRKARVSSVRLR